MMLAVDSEGRGIDNMAWVKSKIYPIREDIRPEEIERAFCEFSKRGMIVRYTVGGRSYFWLPKFKDYQTGTQKEAKSLFPPPPTPELVESYSGVAPEQVCAAASASESESVSESAFVSESANGKIFKIYEREFGTLTPMICDALQAAEKDYPVEWFESAFREAATNNKRSWKYAETILKRWKVEGYQSKSNGKKQPGYPGGDTLEDEKQRIMRSLQKVQGEVYANR